METKMSALPISPIPILLAVRSDGDVVAPVGGIVGTVGKVACSAGDVACSVDEVIVCCVGEVVCSVGGVVGSRRSCKGLPVATLPPEVAAVSFPAQG